MRRTTSAIAILLLAACGGQGANEQAASNGAGGAGESASSGSDSVQMQPGEWESTVEVLSMNISNMPGGMRPPIPAPITTRTCLTAAQVSRPNANFFTGNAESAGCTYENFSMEGGRIQGTVQCSIAGTTSRTTMNGQFTPTSYEITSQVQATAAGMTTEQESRVRARRVGDCPAG